MARQQDSESDLAARIERERNPVKKAKYEIRLGHLKLERAVQAGNQGDMERCYELLRGYVDRMRGAWETLRKSGRRPLKQPQGFKDLDIALRQDARMIDDLKHRVAYLDRAPVEKAAKEVEELRSEVYRALFPGQSEVKSRQPTVGAGPRNPSKETPTS